MFESLNCHLHRCTYFSDCNQITQLNLLTMALKCVNLLKLTLPEYPHWGPSEVSIFIFWVNHCTVVDYDFLCSQWCEGHTNWTKEKEDITQIRVSPRVLSPLVQCLSYTYLITDPVPWHHWSAVPLVPTECSNRCNQNVLGSLVGMESKRHKQKSMCEWPEWWGLLRPWPSLVGGGQGGM